MKTLINYALLFLVSFIFGMILARVANAQECSSASRTETKTISSEVPKALQGAIIVVMTTDGNRYQMNADEFKVVPRRQQHVVVKETRTCSVPAKADRKLNRVSVLGGQGPQGHLRTKTGGGVAEVESQVGLILGAQYTRQVNDVVSIGIQVQDNETALSVVGFEF